MSENSSNKRSGFTIFVTLLVILGAVAFWYFAIYSDFGPKDTQTESGNYIAAANDQTNLTTLDVNIQADIAGVDIQYYDTDHNVSFSANWTYEYFISERYENDPFTVEIQNQTVNETVYYDVNINYDDEINPLSVKNFKLTIFLNPTFEYYAITSNIEVGSAKMTAINKTFTEMSITTTTGAIDLELINSTIETSEMLFSTTTGGIDLDVSNLKLSTNTLINVDTTTGGGDINWIQNFGFGANLSLSLSSSVGGYNVNIQAPLSVVKYDISTNDNVGGTDFTATPDFVEVEDNHYQSPGYQTSTADLFQIYTTTDVGGLDININAED